MLIVGRQSVEEAVTPLSRRLTYIPKASGAMLYQSARSCQAHSCELPGQLPLGSHVVSNLARARKTTRAWQPCCIKAAAGSCQALSCELHGQLPLGSHVVSNSAHPHRARAKLGCSRFVSTKFKNLRLTYSADIDNNPDWCSEGRSVGSHLTKKITDPVPVPVPVPDPDSAKIANPDPVKTQTL